MRGTEREAIARRAAARTERPPAERGTAEVAPLEAVASAVGNRAFAAATRNGSLGRPAIARGPNGEPDDDPDKTGPPEMPAPVPPRLKALADGQVVPVLKEVSEALRSGDPLPPERLKKLREKVVKTRALFDTVAAPAGRVGDNWFGARAETALARTLLDDMIKPGSDFDLRMSWGKSFGTAKQLAGILGQDEAASAADTTTPRPATAPSVSVEFEVCPRIENAIKEIPALIAAEDTAPLTSTAESTADIPGKLVDLAQGHGLGPIAAIEFEKGRQLVEQWALPEADRAAHVADRVDSAVSTASDLGGDHGWSASPLEVVTPTIDPAPSPNPLPPPPPPPPGSSF